jgi:hypothetical protein
MGELEYVTREKIPGCHNWINTNRRHDGAGDLHSATSFTKMLDPSMHWYDFAAKLVKTLE